MSHWYFLPTARMLRHKGSGTAYKAQEIIDKWKSKQSMRSKHFIPNDQLQASCPSPKDIHNRDPRAPSPQDN